MPTPFERPTLTPEEIKSLERASRRIFMLSRKDQVNTLLAALVENARLAKEVNIHRAARGYELLPTYEPEVITK